MNIIFLAISYILSGLFLKLSDDFFDEKNNKFMAIVLAILCGVFTGIAVVNNLDAAYIFLGILIGNFIAFKVDGIHHMFTFIVFAVFILIFNIPHLNLILLGVLVLSALIDEIGNDNEYIYSRSIFLKYFFDYRFTMKLVIFVLAILGYLNIVSFILFILFELSYELARVIFEKYINVKNKS